MTGDITRLPDNRLFQRATVEESTGEIVVSNREYYGECLHVTKGHIEPYEAFCSYDLSNRQGWMKYVNIQRQKRRDVLQRTLGDSAVGTQWPFINGVIARVLDLEYGPGIGFVGERVDKNLEDWGYISDNYAGRWALLSFSSITIMYNIRVRITGRCHTLVPRIRLYATESRLLMELEPTKQVTNFIPGALLSLEYDFGDFCYAKFLSSWNELTVALCGVWTGCRAKVSYMYAFFPHHTYTHDLSNHHPQDCVTQMITRDTYAVYKDHEIHTVTKDESGRLFMPE